MNLSGIDLNLLVVFEALLTERNVTRAASRIGLSQPAMSNALARLRTLLGDPLLVRASGGMVPSARALDLLNPIRKSLGEIQAALDKTPMFDPLHAARTFTLATIDYAAILILPRLLAQLRAAAPQTALHVRWLGPSVRILQGGPLETGEIDVLLVPFPVPPDLPPRFHGRSLLEDRLVSVVRSDHPKVRRRLTLDTLVALDHLLVDPMGNLGTTIVDASLAALGRSRRVVMTVPDFWTAAQVVSRTDMTAMLTERVARVLLDSVALKILRPPLKIPGLAFCMVWHERTHHDPALAWLRSQITRHAAEEKSTAGASIFRSGRASGTRKSSPQGGGRNAS